MPAYAPAASVAIDADKIKTLSGMGKFYISDQPPVDAIAVRLESRDEPSARHSPVAYIHGRVRRK